MTATASSFAPVFDSRARVLILGSVPGKASLQAGQYYAHPRNGFWPLMGFLFGIERNESYDFRLEKLRDAGVALWDVIACCERTGSLDSAITPETIQINDFGYLFDACPHLFHIFFNGAAAEKLFRQYVCLPTDKNLQLLRLPSTSPAHAALTFRQKCKAWTSLSVALGLSVPFLEV